MNPREPQLLWPDGPSGPTLPDGIEAPTLAAYEPDNDIATGAAIVVCPGGGYGVLADHEGEPVARWLNGLGIAAYVLRYRLGPHSQHPAMLHDAARAVRTVRANAAEWGIDPGRIGILGFSAGGHLASTLATHYDAGDPGAADPIDRVSSRPDIAVLIYPVIAMQGPYSHAWCIRNLLGESPDAALAEDLTNHLRVTPDTPPVFMIHTATDEPVPCENSLLMAMALSAAKVPFALHLYERGDHGYGLGQDDPVLRTWPGLCADWLGERGFLSS